MVIFHSYGTVYQRVNSITRIFKAVASLPLEAAITRNLGEDGSTMAELEGDLGIARRLRWTPATRLGPKWRGLDQKGGARRGFVGSLDVATAKCPRSHGFQFFTLWRWQYETLEGLFSFLFWERWWASPPSSWFQTDPHPEAHSLTCLETLGAG